MIATRDKMDDHRSTRARRRRLKLLGAEIAELSEELLALSDRLREAELEARVGRRTWRVVAVMKEEISALDDEVAELIAAGAAPASDVA